MDANAPDQEELVRPPWGAYGRTAVFVAVAGFSKLMVGVCNSLEVRNGEQWEQAVLRREPGRGLITVSNHTSTFDDPGVISSMVPLSYFASEHRHHGLRWSLCAREICHSNTLLSQFFLNGKTLPIDRGGGLSQPIMLTTAALLRRGDWVHVFPEGRIYYGGTLGPLRWGIGKLLCDSVAGQPAGSKPPIVLPFYHSGMGNVMPMHTSFPRPAGHHVTVTVGQPLELSDVTCRCNMPGEDQQRVWRDITERIGQALAALEAAAPPNPDQLQRKRAAERRRRRAGPGDGEEERRRQEEEQGRHSPGMRPGVSAGVPD